MLATETHVYAIEDVAKMLGEDLQMLAAIVENDDILHDGAIISIHTGNEKAITALTDDGIDELKDMLDDARRSPDGWHGFLKDFVADPDIVTGVKEKGSGSNRAIKLRAKVLEDRWSKMPLNNHDLRRIWAGGKP